MAPITPKLGWDEVKAFAKAIADALVSCAARTATRRTRSRSTREGKIFVDYLRNQRGGSAIVNYSTRAKNGRAGRLPAPLGRVEGAEGGSALHRQDAAGAAESVEARSVGRLFLHPPVDHGQGAKALGLRR